MAVELKVPSVGESIYEVTIGEWLKGEGIKALSVLGLATDYCVKFTALDARELGFDVTLLAGGCRGVELKPGDIANALYELRTAGVLIQS